MKQTKYIILLFILLFNIITPAHAEQDSVYIFTSFREPSKDGMRYLYSHDALHWDTIPGIILRPQLGVEDERLRDPSIVQGPDGTYHLVWTTQWKGARGIGYASSRDLFHWSEQRLINVMDSIETNNVWAPELFYDDELQLFFIIWASQIPREAYTAADSLGTNAANRLWYTTTRDFKTFAPAKPYYDPGFNSIDAFLLKRAHHDYVLILKDNRKPGFSNLFCAFSNSPYGPFHTADNAPMGQTPSVTFGRTFSEGPCAIKVDDHWIIYFDLYHPQSYGAVTTTDFKSFTNITDSISVPITHKHGTIIKTVY